jgi:hypothetical protein
MLLPFILPTLLLAFSWITNACWLYCGKAIECTKITPIALVAKTWLLDSTGTIKILAG